MPDVTDPQHQADARALRSVYATYKQAEDMINIGAYARGSNEDCDVGIEMKSVIDRFLTQGSGVSAVYPETCRRLVELADRRAMGAFHVVSEDLQLGIRIAQRIG